MTGRSPAEPSEKPPLAQIFSPSADTWLRVAIAGTVVLLTGLGFVGGGLAKSDYRTEVGWVKDQPVPFSHRHHAGELGIDCRYCHTGVETGAIAGLPPTHTCMTCHSQIWTEAEALAPVRESYVTGTPIHWQRVAQLPDYVYFDHHVHINNGVECTACHGHLEQMPLTWRAEPFTMGFCLECHESVAGVIRRAGRSSLDAERLTNCETCHR